MKNAGIWLVDDDEIYIHVTKKVLAHLSDEIEISSFDNGLKAIEHLKECLEDAFELPRLILLDINMPVMDGWGFLNEFKKLNSKITKPVKIYMVTSSKDQRDHSKAEEFE